MSVLFSPVKIGELELVNRFVHSATYECMAEEDGTVSRRLITRYRTLARGQVGLIIPGYMFVHPMGQALKRQTGIHSDAMIPGLRRLCDAVHELGGRIVFQLAHAGRQTTRRVIGQKPRGPSTAVRDPIHFFRPQALNETEIKEIIAAFAEAAGRGVEAGADGVQLHAAHGYLLNQFLSPFFNRRRDRWGGSDENRFRLLREVCVAVRERLKPGMPLLVKLNVNDFTPKPGVTDDLAARYAGWLAELGLDGLEVSCGNFSFAPMNTCRGEVPVAELLQAFPAWKKPIARIILGGWVGRFSLEEAYNLGAAQKIRRVIGAMPLALVGGLRSRAVMEEILAAGHADLISMSRPFIREPHLVRHFRQGTLDAVTCKSCNRCMASVPNELPVRCYYAGFPEG